MCICSTRVQLPTEVREGIRYPGPGVTGGCKPPIVGAGNKLKFSGRAASTLDHWTISPAQVNRFLLKKLFTFVYLCAVCVCVSAHSGAHC